MRRVGSMRQSQQSLGILNLQALKRGSLPPKIKFDLISATGQVSSLNRSKVLRSQPSEQAENEIRFTSHLNLKEGISNMKVSYIPDFGYSQQLNFSIDSDISTKQNWRVLANQILMPFAPKSSTLHKTIHQHSISQASKSVESTKKKREKHSGRRDQFKIVQEEHYPKKSQSARSLRSIQANLKTLRRMSDLKTQIKSIQKSQCAYKQDIHAVLKSLTPRPLTVRKCQSEKILTRISHKQTNSEAMSRNGGIFTRGSSQHRQDYIEFTPGSMNRVPQMRLDFLGDQDLFCLKRPRAQTQQPKPSQFKSCGSDPIISSQDPPSPKKSGRLLHRQMSERVQLSIKKLYPKYIEEMQNELARKPKVVKRKKTYLKPTREQEEMLDFLTTEPTEAPVVDAPLPPLRTEPSESEVNWKLSAREELPPLMETIPSPPVLERHEQYENLLVEPILPEGVWLRKKRKN